MAAPTIIPRSSYYDGPVTESDRARGRAGAPDFTVYGADDLKLSAHPTIPFALVVSKGKASAFGVTAFVEKIDGSDLVVQCDPNSSGTRWDIITLRYDWRPELGGPTDIRAFNAGGKQIPTNLENTPGTLVDQPAWLVRWTDNASAPAEYVDLRCFASNGGMMANDVLALKYLQKPGAAVRVGNNLWTYQMIGNQQWDWKATSLISPRVDGVPADRVPIIKTGNVAVNTNAAGDAYYNFPEPFPNALVSCVVTDTTDPAVWPSLTAKFIPGYSGRTRVGARIYETATGGALINRSGLFYSFIAIGY